jgi:SpoVK/Ycf46/Vps4 family AAA+-type ATPase
VIAAELDVDLYRVDLSQVVSKYIGETEKNLHQVFDAAEHSGAVLVIDEADALFGQRSEVRDSHDRYANIEVSYLLQRMESYRGLAVLTTNLQSNIDDAFVRRLGFIVVFPFPGQQERKALWERAFPDRVPVQNLQPARLAQLNLSGGSIRNVALHAAFLAAERGSPVTMADILRGARSEYDKLDRPLTPTELAGWPS